MSNFCNSNFISNSFNNSAIDLMSCTSDSYPIGPVNSTSASGDFIYGSFMCVGDLLVQFSSNQSNALLVNSTGSCIYPIEMSGKNLPNAFLITGNNATQTGSVIAAYDVSSSGFGYSNVPSDNNIGSYINFLCISPRPTYFKPKVPFITTGSPYIYWSSSTTLTLLYTDANNPGTITFTDTSSMNISINLMSGGGGGGSGGTGGNNGPYVGGQGGSGGSACQWEKSVVDVSLNTQYYCVVGKGGTGGPSVSYNNTNFINGNAGQNGSPSWVGPSYDDSSNCLGLATGNNTRGVGGGNLAQPFSASSNNAVNGLGGYGGNSNNGSINDYTNDGQVGADYYTISGADTNVPGGAIVAYAAGGGGGKYHNGDPGNGGTGSPNGNYGGGGKGGGNSGSDGVSPSIIIGSVFFIGINWGGGGGGGGGGNCDSNGNGSTSGAGGNGADGYIQITLTFNS